MKLSVFLNNPKATIFGLAFILRIIFLLYGAEYYYGTNIHRNGDSSSYRESFKNLIQYGEYTFDRNNDEAYFGRLPGYPFFWGISYMIVGEDLADVSTALIQTIADSYSAVLIFLIAILLFRSFYPAFISGLIYAINPFFIVWVPIIGTETAGIFLCLILFYFLFKLDQEKWYNLAFLGFLVAIAFYFRIYLGILIISVIIHLATHNDFFHFIRKSLIVGFSFLILYSIWPIRNYLQHDKVMFLKPVSAGYERYSEDIMSARRWIYGWSHDADKYLTSLAKNQSVSIPDYVFSDEDEREYYDSLTINYIDCGSGFYNWRTNKKFTGKNCNSILRFGFDILSDSYKKNHPFLYYFKVPGYNIKKFFFKSELAQDSTGVVVKILFFLRSVLLILSVLGVILFFSKEHIPLLFFSTFMLLFISFYLRQMEMRYMIQAEALLIIFSGPVILEIVSKMLFYLRGQKSLNN